MRKKLGLDLGTGKCCVAIAQNAKVTVLPDVRGDKTTPSFVAFNEYRTFAGSDARDQANINATNTAYGIKTILGRTLEDPVVVRKLDSKSNVALPFPPYRKGKDGVPEFQFEYKKKTLTLRPEQITALLIGKMKSIAEKYLDSDVNGAVISVPVSFNTAQRQATLDAARIAGFKYSTLVNCTTAAAVAYWDQNPRMDDCIAVVDIGAGSVNFAIISIKSGNIKVEEAYGDCEVGGSDIDLCMMSALIKKFNEENSVEFQKSTETLMRLKLATESLKHNLSQFSTAGIHVNTLNGEVDMSMAFTRKEMVESCKEVLGVVSAGLSRLKSSKLWDKVRCAVVVGGSTRIPAVQSMISSELNKPVDQSLNKDEAIACGAALLGSGSTTQPEVVDVLGRRIWCESKIEDDFVVFDVGATLLDEKYLGRPLSGNMEVWENLKSLKLRKQEDTFKLCSIVAHNKNKPEDEGGLIFSVNENGIFRAEKIREGKSMDIALEIPCLNINALSVCVETHERFLRESEELEENEDAMNDLEYFCSEQRQFIEKELDGNDELMQFLDSVVQWLEDTPDATKKECELKRCEIHDKIHVLKQHTRLDTNAKQADFTTLLRNERVPSQPDGDRTDRLVQFPSCETKTMETISCQTGSAGHEEDSQFIEYYNDDRNNSEDRMTHSKPSKDAVPYSNDHSKNLVHRSRASEASGSRHKTSIEVNSRGDNTNKNSYTQGSQNYSAYKPLPGNGAFSLWSRGTREQLPDLGHQPVSHTKSGPDEGSSVRKDITPFPEMNRPRSKPNPPDYLTGDLGFGSKSGYMGSDYNSSQNYSQQSYQSEGYRSKRLDERTARNDVHKTPVLLYSCHVENLNGGKTAMGSRSRASLENYSVTNQNDANSSSDQASLTSGVPKIADDVTSPQVYGGPSPSTGRSVTTRLVQQQQDRHQLSHTSPKGGFGSGRHTQQPASGRVLCDGPHVNDASNEATETKIEQDHKEVGEECSEKNEDINEKILKKVWLSFKSAQGLK